MNASLAIIISVIQALIVLVAVKLVVYPDWLQTLLSITLPVIVVLTAIQRLTTGKDTFDCLYCDDENCEGCEGEDKSYRNRYPNKRYLMTEDEY